MLKDKILHEIKRLAAKNGGKPPGRDTFARITGIKNSQWDPSIWLRWSEALSEAGFTPNELQGKIPDEVVLEKYVSLIRKLGHVPVRGELRREATSNKDFPSDHVFKRFGSKDDLIEAVANYCIDNGGLDDVLAICEKGRSSKKTVATVPAKVSVGYVYLIKSGKHHKIGRTNSIGRREWELSIKIPIPPQTIHYIITDDPVGVEAYWHKRFADKRGEGGWFELSPEDIAAFKRWKKII